MAANTNPIFTLVPDIQWGTTAITTANTAKDGTGTVLTVFTADATNGGFVQKIRFRPAGTNVATVARVFINNGSTTSTAANNILYDEIGLAATTLSEVLSQIPYELPMNIALPPGYRILITLGTTVAAGYYVSVVGGKY
jgi:hypothetical protein